MSDAEVIREALEWANKFRSDGNDRRYQDALAALDSLEAERDEARRRAHWAETVPIADAKERVERAEAEVARLRGALKEIHSKPYRAEEITARVFLASVGETDG